MARAGRWAPRARSCGTSPGRRRGSAPSSGRTCSPGCAGSASPISRTAGWSADTGSSIAPRTAARPGCRRKAETGEPAMSSGTSSEEDKRALYWLGERLIDYRHPVMIVVLIITAYFAYLSFQLKLETSFGDLLPQSHPFVQIHNKYAGTFGGANNKRIVHNTESIYGLLVSLDDRAALVRANFIESRLNHRLTFDQINERVIAPFEKGWIDRKSTRLNSSH